MTPAVAVNATLLAGSVHEPASLPGVAYLTKRTIDRGTADRTSADIAQLLDDRGVSLRSSVSRHTFSVTCVCLSEDFDDLLSLIADVVRHPVFAEDEIEKRRLQAITSVREAQDDPARMAARVLLAQLYGAAHPYGRSVKGTVDSLERITRADLVAYHARHFVPGALRLAVAGDVDPGQARDAAARVFGDWAGPEPADEPVAPPLPVPHRIERLTAMPGKSQSDIAYGFTTIRRLDPRYHAYQLMNTVLGQFGLGGRLADNIRERQGMAYYAYSTLDPNVGEGPLVVRAGVDPANVRRAIDAIDAEVRALGQHGPTDAEFDDARASLIGSIPRMLETNENIADFLLHTEQFGLGLDYDRRLPDLVRQVDIAHVREAARDVLDPSRAVVSVAGPAHS